MISLQRHIEALTQASLEIEARSRRPGGSYMRDTAAAKSLQRGLAIFTTDDGRGFEIHPIGDAEATVPSEHGPDRWGFESYEQMNQRSFTEATRRSHEHARSHGGVEPVNIAKDAALVRQRLNSAAHQRRLTADAYHRNASIAARMKAESDKLWKKERIA